MSAQSVYVIPCLCGTTVESHERDTQCPTCGRLLHVETLAEAEAAERREKGGPV